MNIAQISADTLLRDLRTIEADTTRCRRILEDGSVSGFDSVQNIEFRMTQNVTHCLAIAKEFVRRFAEDEL